MTYQEQQDAIKQKVVGAYNDAADRASNVADKMSREASGAKRDIANAASDIASRASNALEEAGVDTESLSKALRSSFDTVGKSLAGIVRERPVSALLVTAAVGLVVGAMSSR